MPDGTSANRRIYLDANVLFHYLVQEVIRTEAPEAYKKGVESYGRNLEYRDKARLAGVLLEKIDSSTYDGVFSALVFLELRKTLRTFLCRFTKLDMAGIEATIEKAFAVLWDVHHWYSPELEHEHELDEDRAELKWYEVMLRAYEVHKANAGERDSKSHIKHVGTNATDALHIALAEEFGCGYLVTFDEDFVTAQRQVSLNVRIVHLPHEIGILTEEG